MNHPQKLHSELESIRDIALREAHKLYAERVEQGMNAMVQAASRAASLAPFQPENFTGAKGTTDGADHEA